MTNLKQPKQYKLVVLSEVDKTLRALKKRKIVILQKLEKQIAKIVKDPIIGKPLRNVLRNCRRVLVGSFILVYEIYQDEIRLIDFDHHDRIYKKFRTKC